MSETLKVCFVCGEPKPVDAFYPHPRMADGRLGKCAECCRVYARSHRKPRPNRPRAPGRVRAKNATRYLVHGPCEICGVTPAQGHHEDYSKPKEVRWLCRQHHGEAHRVY